MAADCPSLAEPQQTPLDRRLGPVMFWLSLLWLGMVGISVHLLQDTVFHPGHETPLPLDEVRGRFDDVALQWELGLLALWPLFLLEGLVHWATGAAQLRQHVWHSLFPFLRLIGRDHVNGRTLWLPMLGWRPVDANLECVLERHFSFPMIVAALLVLPVLAMEFLWHSALQKHASLGLVVHVVGGLIWLAFAVEFIVMVSIVRRRWLYVRLHWLDLAIICLPLVGFLRVLRVGRVGRVLRIQQLMRVTEASKAFRLRGLAFRVWRAVLLFEVVDRVMQRDIEHKIAVLRNRLAEREEEADKLRRQIAELETMLRETEARIAAEQAAQAALEAAANEDSPVQTVSAPSESPSGV